MLKTCSLVLGLAFFYVHDAAAQNYSVRRADVCAGGADVPTLRIGRVARHCRVVRVSYLPPHRRALHGRSFHSTWDSAAEGAALELPLPKPHPVRWLILALASGLLLLFLFS